MIAGILNGVASYQRAFGMLSQYRLWRFVIIPGIISLLLMLLLVMGPAWAFLGSAWEQSVIDAVPWEWAQSIVKILVDVLLVLALMFLVFFLAKYLVMVIVAPFMSILSEKIERAVKGSTGASQTNFMQDLIRGLRIALRNIWRELIITLFLLLLNLIPVVGNLLSIVLIFLVQAYYAGFGNMDYTLERKGYNVSQSVAYVRSKRGIATGNGSIFLVIFLIPILGWFLAPVYGTISATLLIIENEDARH